MARVNALVRDKSQETSQVGVYITDAADIDAWSVPHGLSDAFAGHIDALSIGVVATVKFAQDTQAENAATPASPYANRELGLRFYLRDQVTAKLNTITVPAPDLDAIAITAGSDLADLSDEPVAAFVTWLEANALSDVGNAIIVEKAVLVGRNN